jgi:cobalt-zinc-cadmium efflux system protein
MPEAVHGETEAEIRVLRGFRLALELSIVILIVEAIGAYFSRSLAVTVDAVHNIPDIAAFAVSWGALRATEQGAIGRYTFGPHRLEVFAGLFNAALVLGTGLAFGFEAYLSLSHGNTFAGPIDPYWVLLVAVPVLALRGVNVAVLGRVPHQARDLNLVSVLVHLASDLLITVALIAAGVVLLLHPSSTWVDAGSALAIAVILVIESIPLFRDGWEVLTEKIPRNLSLDAISRSALSVPSVTDIHDVHVWAVCPTLVCMTAHVQVTDMSVQDCMLVVAELRKRMEGEFGILHSVFEVEALPTGARPHA